MLIYITTFFISLIFIYIACNCKNKRKFIFFSSIGIFIPCILAALRSNSIGTDVNVYQFPIWKSALTCPNFNVFISNDFNIKEYLYLIFIFVFAKIFENFSVWLFVQELLIILPIYIALIRTCDNKKQIVIGMFIYYFYIYNSTYNLARQSIALAFCVLAFTYLEEKKYKKMIFWGIVAFEFHNTALFFLIVVSLYFIFNSRLKKSDKIGLSVIFIYLYTFVVLNIVNLIRLIGKIIPNFKYSIYITQFLNKMLLNKTEFLFWSIMLIIGFLFNKEFKSSIKNYYYYYFSLLIVIIGLYLGTVIEFANRILYYFSYIYLIIVLPKTVFCIKKLENRQIYIVLMFLLLIFYWFVVYCINNGGETIPYVFRESNIIAI